jgi:hypothetical protein
MVSRKRATVMSRANQDWLDGDAIEIEEPKRSPYPHELNREGTACAEDCAACEWVRRQPKKNAVHNVFLVFHTAGFAIVEV